jgi:flagellar hook assembly protein FlgD
MVAGNKYTFNITGTMDGSQITLSKDNQANSYSTFEEDGTTPAIGTDYNSVTKITVDFDGVKCSIVSLDKRVDDIEARVTVNEGDIATNTANILANTQQRAILGGGAIIDGNFDTNLEPVSGTVVLSAGEYGHTMWKAGSGGCTYTFATLNGVTTITISAGTLLQIIEGVILQSGDYILSWDGTAQAQIDIGGFAVSPITKTIVGATNTTIEFGTGTVSRVKFEIGTIVTNWLNQKPNEILEEVNRYYWSSLGDSAFAAIASGDCSTTTLARVIIEFPVTMRTGNGTLTFGGNLILGFDNVGESVTNLVANAATTSSKNAGVDVSVASGLTAGKGCRLINDNNTTAFVAFDDRL